jgi:NADH dehydrogenase
MPHIVIAGGGFAGFWAGAAARAELLAAGADTDITLVDRDDHLVLRPRLYEAFGEHLRIALKPRLEVLGIEFVQSEICAIDGPGVAVALQHAGKDKRHVVAGDRLVLALGSVQKALPIPAAEGVVHDIDTYGGAARFDRSLVAAVSARKPGGVDIAVIGAGFTGIELACELRTRVAKISGDVGVADRCRVALVDQAEVVGASLGTNPRPIVLEALEHARVRVFCGRTIRAVERAGVLLDDGERIRADLVVVATGLTVNPLIRTVRTQAAEDGRLIVDPFLAVPDMDGVFATGDCAFVEAEPGHPALMSCQHAMTMGRVAGRNVARDLLGAPLVAYAQPGYQTCLDLGTFGALLTRGWERDVVASGMEAKSVKQAINGRIIVPPLDRDALLDAARR